MSLPKSQKGSVSKSIKKSAKKIIFDSDMKNGKESMKSGKMSIKSNKNHLEVYC